MTTGPDLQGIVDGRATANVGHASLERARPVTSQSVFRVGSISKLSSLRRRSRVVSRARE
jgi:CubicO group peptidase (beta-lactamase class C family)